MSYRLNTGDQYVLVTSILAPDADCSHDFSPLFREVGAIVAREVAAVEAVHRDLTRRLGFGDNVSEPQADNDTIVRWFEEQSRDANEWQESQLWRNDCYVAGHPEDDDCHECDPALRLEAAEAKVAAVEALADWHETKADKARLFRPEINGENRVMDKAAQVHDDAAARLRAALREARL